MTPPMNVARAAALLARDGDAQRREIDEVYAELIANLAETLAELACDDAADAHGRARR